ncbi:MAG: hypothetical protein WAK93_14770, partial [Solirubrobacteraceae bacterium]
RVEVVRQEVRGLRKGSGWEWEWVARRRGQQEWRHGTSAREAIRQARLVAAGQHPAWLAQAAARAERELSGAETSGGPASGDAADAS